MHTINNKKKGRLEVICGSMFSGKSEELIRRLKRAKIAKKKILTFKHTFDTRSSAHTVASHDGNTLTAIALAEASELLNYETDHVDVIGIDEVQFFSHDSIPVILQLLDQGKRIVVAGLNLDYRGIPFGPMPTLISLADTVTKLSAICILCGADAYFSQRLVNGTPASHDDPLVQVGAEECYQARCRSCFVMDTTKVWQKTK